MEEMLELLQRAGLELSGQGVLEERAPVAFVDCTEVFNLVRPGQTTFIILVESIVPERFHLFHEVSEIQDESGCASAELFVPLAELLACDLEEVAVVVACLWVFIAQLLDAGPVFFVVRVLLAIWLIPVFKVTVLLCFGNQTAREVVLAEKSAGKAGCNVDHVAHEAIEVVGFGDSSGEDFSSAVL